MKATEAIKQMRYLSDNGIPFSFDFISINQSTGASNGLVRVDNALLRSNRQSSAHTLQAYTDLKDDQPRFFHIPLVTKFNGIVIRNEY